MMTMKQIMAWYTLSDKVLNNHQFMDNFQSKTHLWYFRAVDGNRTIVFNYRKYGERIVLHGNATIETCQGPNGTECVCYDTITKFKKALQ